MLKMQRSFSPTWTLVLLIHLVWMSSTMVFSPVEAARSKVFESEYSSGTHLASKFVFSSRVQCAWVIAFLEGMIVGRAPFSEFLQSTLKVVLPCVQLWHRGMRKHRGQRSRRRSMSRQCSRM
jgi:hypothetical protein